MSEFLLQFLSRYPISCVLHYLILKWRPKENVDAGKCVMKLKNVEQPCLVLDIKPVLTKFRIFANMF